jgi:hypothetical protein
MPVIPACLLLDSLSLSLWVGLLPFLVLVWSVGRSVWQVFCYRASCVRPARLDSLKSSSPSARGT